MLPSEGISCPETANPMTLCLPGLEGPENQWLKCNMSSPIGTGVGGALAKGHKEIRGRTEMRMQVILTLRAISS